jgi:serine/threonine protein kinase
MERISQYELLERIGKGSFGEVYKSFAKETGEIVAVKVVDLTVRNR